MLFIIVFGAGAIIAASIGFSGLVHRRLEVSKTKVLTGTAARIVGTLCLTFAALCAIATAIFTMLYFRVN